MGTREEEIKQLESEQLMNAIEGATIRKQLSDLDKRITKLSEQMNKTLTSLVTNQDLLLKRMLMHEKETGFDINEAMIKYPSLAGKDGKPRT